jgi:hypothetical protein
MVAIRILSLSSTLRAVTGGMLKLGLWSCYEHVACSKKFPAVVELDCNNGIHGNGYLITYKVGLLSSRAHKHTHICNCSIKPAIFGSTSGRFVLESSRVRRGIRFDVIHGCEMLPLRTIFRVGNSQKSLGAKSREYGGWVMTGNSYSARDCCTRSDEWLAALLWCRNHGPRCSSRPFLQINSANSAKLARTNVQ